MQTRKGSLTIEASIALTVFIFLNLSMLGFGRIYRAQSLVAHAALQTSQALAIESYYRETISKSGSAEFASKLIKFSGALGWSSLSGYDDWYASLGDKGTDFYKIVKDTFVYAIAEDEESANQILKSVGIAEGMAGIDFKYSAVKNSEIIVNVQYKVGLPFPFFGKREVSLSKSAKTKAFKKIEDNNGYTEPLGSGGGSFRGDDMGAPGSSGGGFRGDDMGAPGSSGGGFRDGDTESPGDAGGSSGGGFRF